MADKTSIEWTSATWNPITGCTLVSEGCRFCYAARMAATRLKHHPSRKGLAVLNADGVAKFTGEVRFNERWLYQPLRWRKPRKIFVCAHGDLFHESVPDQWIDWVFAVMALAPQHTFQVLTKRPERMRKYLATDPRDLINETAAALVHWDDMPMRDDWPMNNVWLGTSVEDQATADERIPYLLETPAAVRWISAEPLLGPIDLTNIGPNRMDAISGWMEKTMGQHNPAGNWDEGRYLVPINPLAWVVAGGESGRRARTMDPAWVRSLRDQCDAEGVPFLFKQWGGRTSKAGGRMLDGRLWDEYPERMAA